MKRIIWAFILISAMAVFFTMGGGYAFADIFTSQDGVISATDLLEAAGIEVLAEEEPYLSLLGLAVDTRIPASCITVHWVGGTANVTAVTYSKGQLVWIPHRVQAQGDPVAFALSDAQYVAALPATQEDTLSVYYRATLSVDKDKLESFANVAYQDAAALVQQQQQWDDDYDAQLAAYQEYEAYLQAKAAYEQYRVYEKAYRQWQDAKAHYDAYLAEEAVYEANLAAYNAYQLALSHYEDDLIAYQEYQSKLGAYQVKLAAYQAYVAKLETIERQLYLVGCIKTNYTDLQRSVYNAVMGEAVTEVIKESEVLTSNYVNVDKEVIKSARASTIKLREWFSTYFGYKTDVERYAYYMTNYRTLVENWNKLLAALDNLYSNKKVRLAIKERDKERKFMILLAELAVIGNALNDQPQTNYGGNVSFLADWRVNGETTTEILGGVIVQDLDDATPLESGFPHEVAEPEYLEPVAEPYLPPATSLPTPPAEVADPGQAPEAVAKVDKPQEVSSVEMPVRRTLSEEQAAKAMLVTEGVLTSRTVTQDLEIELETVVAKQIVVETITVTFVVEGQEDLQVQADCGTYVEYTGPVPTKLSNVAADYQFDYWVDKTTGARVSLDAVEKDLIVIPHFESIAKTYTVSWISSSVIKTETLPYGSQVTPPASPTKSSQGNAYFTFDKWVAQDGTVWQQDFALLGNVTFTAQFARHTYVDESAGEVELIRTQDQIIIDSSDNYCVEMDIGAIAALSAAEDRGLSIGLVGITVDFADYAMDEIALAGSTVSWHSLSRGKYDEEYRLSVSDWQGRATVEIATSVPQGAKLYEVTPDGMFAVEFVRNAHAIRFSAKSGATYRYVMEYQVSVLAAPLGITLSIDETSAYPDDTIAVTAVIPQGIRLVAVKMRVGEQESVIEGSRFVMPKGDVIVWVEAVEEMYHITFVADGVTLDTYDALYGETITPPFVPTKASDDFYSYKFAGWDHEVTAAIGNDVYTARYSKTPVVPATIAEGTLGKKLKLLIGLGAAGAALLAIGVAVVIVVIWRKKKRKS